jgi:competence protein ComEA
MKKTMHTVLIAVALLVGSALSVAQDKPAAGGAAGAPSAKKDTKAAQPVKPVDINSASKAELKKLPSIGDAEAERIIAGRPYVSKADLVTRKIIPEGFYVQIRRQIVAIPKPDAAKAAAKKG